MLNGLLDDLIERGDAVAPVAHPSPSENPATTGFVAPSPVSPHASDGEKSKAETLPPTLVKAALRVCDARVDGPEQRQQMLSDLASYPADRHAWLTDYLNGEADRLEAPKPDVMDDRRTCSVCTNFRAGRCLAAWRGELPATSRQYHPRPNMMRRCEGYQPNAEDPDRRPGKVRWPGLTGDTLTNVRITL
ncbi:hypothetical protein [Methylococcus capsulatus]|uniref:hypothetical protein n=1 Tax=Methylococcus capsulatus TaxID=414 RepID=UPI001C532D7C|nr:hypothetical protein [Methylococcus capsulatus]QXP90019.1 hypothetical protein KW114_13290 [Methylococcus capsulatus]